MIKSIYDNQELILKAIMELYCPNGYEADLSYGKGNFYKNIPTPKYKFDIEPLFEDVVKSNSGNLPLANNSLNNAVFDPPFITYVKNGRKHNSIIAKQFSGYYSYNELAFHYKETLKESQRVLKPKGILVFKCQDLIHNHKLHATHINVVLWGQEYGLFLKDLFILEAKRKIPLLHIKKQQHARISHCYFLVLEKIN